MVVPSSLKVLAVPPTLRPPIEASIRQVPTKTLEPGERGVGGPPSRMTVHSEISFLLDFGINGDMGKDRCPGRIGARSGDRRGTVRVMDLARIEAFLVLCDELHFGRDTMAFGLGDMLDGCANRDLDIGTVWTV